MNDSALKSTTAKNRHDVKRVSSFSKINPFRFSNRKKDKLNNTTTTSTTDATAKICLDLKASKHKKKKMKMKANAQSENAGNRNSDVTNHGRLGNTTDDDTDYYSEPDESYGGENEIETESVYSQSLPDSFAMTSSIISNDFRVSQLSIAEPTQNDLEFKSLSAMISAMKDW